MQRSLAASSIECAQLLDKLATSHRDTRCSQRSALQSIAVEDQSVRFKVWAGNLGAFQRLPASASLDYRLRESPKIATQIHELLQDLKSVCEDVRAIALGERPNRRSDSELDEDGNAQGSEDELGDHSSENIDDDSEDDILDLSEAEELFESIKDTIASLFRLAVVIRNSSPRDRYARALGGHNPFTEHFDIFHVGEKFPKLDREQSRWLRDRLGKAVAQRRQYLRYAREHRHKLGKEPVELWKPTVEAPKASLQVQAESQAARTNNSRPVTTLADTTASTLFLQEASQVEMDFRDNQSQTSFAFSKGGEEYQDRIELPRLSEISKGHASFECPFCWTIQAIRRENTWRKHVLADLRPYVCTFGDCDVKLYADRKAWFEHELQTHRATWRCHFCGHDDFMSKEAMKKHLRHKHVQEIDTDQLEALTDVGKHINILLKASDCPFCDEWDTYLRKKACPQPPAGDPMVVDPIEFRRHVGSHMQDLALFAIPRGDLEEGEGDADSAASAKAAGAGKKSVSVVDSRPAFSTNSFESADDLEMSPSFVNVEACAETLNNAILSPSPAFEEALINVLPVLSISELEVLKRHCDVSHSIGPQMSLPFSTVARAAYNGRLDATAHWLRSWTRYPTGSLIWLDIARHILTGQTHQFQQALKEAHPGIVDDLQRAFTTFDFPQWLSNALHHAFVVGKHASKLPTSTADIKFDIGKLRAQIASDDRSDSVRESTLRWYITASNRYLRKLFWVYKDTYSSDDLIAQLVTFFVDDTDTPMSSHVTDMARVCIDQLVRHIASGSTDAVTRDARNLHEIFYLSHANDYTPPSKSEYSRDELYWQGMAFRALHLHWNKSHLRAVKSQYEDLYGATVESSIEHACKAVDSGTLLIPFMKALLTVDVEEFATQLQPHQDKEMEFDDALTQHEHTNANDAENTTITTATILPNMSTEVRNPRFEQVTCTIILIKRWWRLYKKTRILKGLLASISLESASPETPAWLTRLSKYPIFAECPGFLNAVQPYIQLQGYEAGDTILPKGENPGWVGWLITGVTKYVATYNHNNIRREWVTKEVDVTIGLVCTLFDIPSLIEHSTETACLLALVPKDDFDKLIQSFHDVQQHIAAKEFRASFPITHACLRIETEFGHPWWHIFHTVPSSDIDRLVAVTRILAMAEDAKVITELVRTIYDELYTPLDLVADLDDIESAKVLLEYGAQVRSQTIKVVLNNENFEFMELILNRPGAAEAANELLRSGNKEDVARLQTMLKEMQGSVPVNVSIERDYKVNLVEPRDILEQDSSLESKLPFPRGEFMVALSDCFKDANDGADSTDKMVQLLVRFPNKPAAAAFLNSTLSHDSNGFSPLTGAIKHRCLMLVTFLLDYGANTNAADGHGLYPLDLAMSATDEREGLAILLINHGASEIGQDYQDQLAQLRERIRIVDEYGKEWSTLVDEADAFCVSGDELSPIHKILRESAHPSLTANIRFTSGQTALDLAVARNNTDLVLLLLQYKARPGEESAILATETNPNLDPMIYEALRNHLPVAVPISTAMQASDPEAHVGGQTEEEKEGRDGESDQKPASGHRDRHAADQFIASETEDEAAPTPSRESEVPTTASHTRAQGAVEQGSGSELADTVMQTKEEEAALNRRQARPAQIDPADVNNAKLIATTSRARADHYDSDADGLPVMKNPKDLFRDVRWRDHTTEKSNDDDFPASLAFRAFIPGRFERLANGTAFDLKRKLIVKLTDIKGNKCIYANLPPRDWINQDAIAALNKKMLQLIRRNTAFKLRARVVDYVGVERALIPAHLNNGKPAHGWKRCADDFDKQFAGKVVPCAERLRPARSQGSLSEEVSGRKEFDGKSVIPVMHKTVKK